MPANLTPAQLAALRAFFIPQPAVSSSGWSLPTVNNTAATYTDAAGNTWHAGWAGGSGPSGADGNQEALTLLVFARDVVPGHHAVGDLQDAFDPNSGAFLYTAAVPVKETGLVPALMFLGAAAAVIAGLGAAAGSALSATAPESLGAGESFVAAGGAGDTFVLPAMGYDLAPVTATFSGEFVAAGTAAAGGIGSALGGGGAAAGGSSLLDAGAGLLTKAVGIVGTLAGIQAAEHNAQQTSTVDAGSTGLGTWLLIGAAVAAVAYLVVKD